MLPIDQYPQITPPVVKISASYPGASALTVSQAVATPIEQELNGTPGMLYMESSSSNSGGFSATVTFDISANPDLAAVEIQNRIKLAESRLPTEVVQNGISVEKQAASQLLTLCLTSTDSKFDEIYLSNFATLNVVDLLRRIPGVGRVSNIGSRYYAMQIWVQPDKLANLGITVADLQKALKDQNRESAAGVLGQQPVTGLDVTIPITTQGRLSSVSQFEEIVVRANPDGSIIRLRDVARISLEAQSYNTESGINGENAAVLAVYMLPGANAMEVADKVKAAMADISKNFPDGLSYRIPFDMTTYISESIHEVYKTLFEALALVIFVVFLSLQSWRATLIPLIAVPISLIGTFGFMLIFGFSLNILTLLGLVLAIGIVVDDAIVVVEAVHAKLDLGYKSARTASIDAMSEISGAIISITLVMSAVFIPVSFIGGTSGTFYREFGITMAISIVISALNALTLSPALCAILLKPKNEDGTERKMSVIDRFHTGFNTAYGKIQEKYKNGVRHIVEHKIIASIAVVIGIAALVIMGATTRTGLIPDEDTGTVFCTVSTPPGTSLSATEKVMDQVDAMLASNPAVNERMRIVGYNFIAGQGSNQGTFIVKLKDFEERNMGQSSTAVLGMIYKQTAAIKGAQILAFQPPMVQGFSATNGLTFSMQDRTGGSVDKFADITREFLKKLNERPEISNAMTSFNSSYPQYLINVDVAKCKQSGISPSAVLTTMQGYYGGLYASNYNAYGKLYRVYIQGDPKTREDYKSLENIYVRTNSGQMAPIKEYVNLERVYGPQVMGRFNLFTSIDVNASAGDGYSSGDAIRAISEVASTTLPSGYTYEFSGLTRSEQQSSNSTMLIFALCLMFVYLILSAQYESYLLPLSVILSIPFGLAGAFLFTNLFGKQNDIYMQISLIMLIGLLAKNAILIVEFALDRRRTGMAISWSAVLGAAARLRPILMTSLAMIIGLLPMLIPGGVGANGNQTLGASAIGGMLIGMLCQIMVVPALFVIFQYLQEKIKPIEFEDDTAAAVDTELIQYARPVDKQKNDK